MFLWKDANPSDLTLLQCISIFLGPYPNLLDFIFHKDLPRLRKPSEQLLEDALCFSVGEIILIQVALDFWDGSGHAMFCDFYKNLSPRNFQNVLKATEILRAN